MADQAELQQLLDERYGDAATEVSGVALNDTLRGLLARRSIRRFTDKVVPDDLLRLLFAAAFSAPSKSDLQQACVVNVRDRDTIARIGARQPSTHWLEHAPVLLVWCGDNRRIRQVCEARGHEFANDHLDAFFNAVVDAGITMQAFITAAESCGLGCCPLSELRNNIDALSAELQLPRYVFPVAGLAVGWPAEQPFVRMRLPNTVTVHDDKFDDSETLRAVADYDRRREERVQTPPSRQRLVDVHGVAEDYGWSEDHARQYSVSARADFGRYIREQGFNLS